jgi:hypothetical protein
MGSRLFKENITIILFKSQSSAYHKFERIVKIARHLYQFMFVCEILETVSFYDHFKLYSK